MLDRYQDKMIAAVSTFGESMDPTVVRTSAVGVEGISTTWWSSRRGLLPRRVVHDCPSTMGKIGN